MSIEPNVLMCLKTNNSQPTKNQALSRKDLVLFFYLLPYIHSNQASPSQHAAETNSTRSATHDYGSSSSSC